jgi:hypothetical protein
MLSCNASSRSFTGQMLWHIDAHARARALAHIRIHAHKLNSLPVAPFFANSANSLCCLPCQSLSWSCRDQQIMWSPRYT